MKQFLFLVRKTFSILLCLSKEVLGRKDPPDNFSTEFTFAHTLSLELLGQAFVGPSDFLKVFANSNSSEKLKAVRIKTRV